MVRSNVTKGIVLVRPGSLVWASHTASFCVGMVVFCLMDFMTRWGQFLVFACALTSARQFVFKAFSLKWTALAQVSGTVDPTEMGGEGMVPHVPSSTLAPGAAAGVWAWASTDSSSAEEKTSTEDHLPRLCAQDCTVMHGSEASNSFLREPEREKATGEKLRVPT